MELLKTLCEIHAPSGEEAVMKGFLLNYIEKNKNSWNSIPEIIVDEKLLQDCLILKFGDPRTAVFAHMDTVGFTVRYENQLVPIGGPDAQSGYQLKGHDNLGPVFCTLEVNKESQLYYNFARPILTGTSLVFECDFRQSKDYISSCYLDNRLGIYNALKLAETLVDGAIVFSAWEEHGGGSVPFLAKYIYERWGVRQALISDITWITDGVHPGKGAVISLRDHSIPRKEFLNRVTSIAAESLAPFQLEVEASGSSDGRELQHSPYPFDWCFIGAAEQNVHSPNEKVHIADIESMLSLYQVMMKKL